MLSPQTLCLLLIPLVLFFYSRIRQSTRGKLPPGPPAEPIIGHTRVFPQKEPGKQFYEWSKIYGDVIHLNILGKHFIVLNSRKAAVDLLDKRGSKYSDRPDFSALGLLGWDNQLVALPFGEAWQKQRRLIQKQVTRQTCLNYRPIQLEQAHVLLRNLLRAPDEFDALLRRYNVAVIAKIVYGRHVETDEDDILKLAKELNEINAQFAKASILTLFGSLKHLPAWFPGAWFIRLAIEKRPRMDRIVDKPFEDALEQIAAGTAEPSFVSRQLEQLDKNDKNYEEDLKLIKTAAGHMWTAGEETTWTTLSTLLLALLIYPETARKAQAEIDRVVGRERLPTFDDYEDLPYVDCLIQESIRWHSAVPLGIPHRAMEDDVYRGMFIPKGSTVMVNTIATGLDETVHKDPHKFWPERYLPENGEPEPAGFGFGRRVCPGRPLAETSIWIVAASMLAVFDIGPYKDEQGNDLVPEAKFKEGIASHPEHFRCHIRPRSKEAEALILQS